MGILSAIATRLAVGGAAHTLEHLARKLSYGREQYTKGYLKGYADAKAGKLPRRTPEPDNDG